jgi:nucleolar protein 56
MTDSPHLFTLLEVAAGYALFEVVAFEEIASSLGASATQQEAITSLPLFSRSVKLKAFQPFQSAEDALENINAISEHAMTDSLKSFLEMNLPKVSSKKKNKESSFTLGVIDSGLATAISEGIPGISCRSDDTIREITRGARLHFSSMIKGLDGGAAEQAQLGLGHSYSRGKVKFNPARSDNMIIQSIALLDQMDKDLNTFAMRVREWYSWHFPELKDLVKDNYMFARCAAFIQDKKSLFPSHDDSNEDNENGNSHMSDHEDKLPGLIEIVGDEEVANAVMAAAKTSMGMDCSPVDMINIINFTQRMVKLAEFRKQLALYLSDKMYIVAPNLSALIGETVAARLISKAGSLTNLAKAPASTVQILGAEKALFRALKTKGNTPKYGLIYHSTFIGRAGAKNKGRISRYLANKCSIATRIDSFSDEPSRIYGEKLREQVEERLKFYETGAAPRKNIDVMEEVKKSLSSGQPEKDDDDASMGEAITPKSNKKNKKEKKSDKKRKGADVDENQEEEEEIKSSKKSAKKAKKEESESTTPKKESSEPKSDKKKSSKKKKKSKE